MHYSLYMYGIIICLLEITVYMPGIQLRRAGCLRTVLQRMALVEMNPRVIGPTYYELLPASPEFEPSVEAFGRLLINLFLKNPSYFVNEFRKLQM